MTEVLPLVVFLILLVVNAPVAIALAAGALTFFMAAQGVPIRLFVQRLVAVTESFPLLAVPFFILAGLIMNEAGITRRLLVLAETLVGHMVGGLARVNVLLSAMMGGMSGSANADAAMQSAMLVPEMERRGYDRAFSAAVTAFSAIITAIIPPSIGLILYGFLANVSIGRLFLAGIVPGILTSVFLLVVVGRASRRNGYPSSRAVPATARERLGALGDAIWALMIPVGLLGGIRFGWYTPTEAGAIAVVYAVLIGAFVYGDLKLARLPGLFVEAAVATSIIMLIICAAQAFGFFMAWERIPTRLSQAILAVSDNPLVLLLLVNLLLLAVGTVLEGGAALVILTPLMAPLLAPLGVDPVHFGIVVVLNLTIAGVTPPVGTLMFTACAISRVRPADFVRSAGWLYAAMAAVLLIVTFVPALSLWLPMLVYG